MPDPVDVERYNALLQRQATPYAVDDRGRATQSSYPESAQSLTPSTGLVTTVRDLAKFDLALKKGLLVLPGTVTQAWSAPWNSAGVSLPHGAGWFVQDHNGEQVVWQFGMSENASSSLMITLPARGLTLISWQQRRPGQAVFADKRRCVGVTVCKAVLEPVRPIDEDRMPDYSVAAVDAGDVEG